MKVKKLIGKTINGFTILDTYLAISKSGNQTRKVKLKCEDCGEVFERCSGVDFDHIKCKCKCEYLKPRKQKFHFIDWQGKRYTQTEFCKIHDINPTTFRYRIKIGMSIEDAIKKEFEHTCEICGKKFIHTLPNKKTCSKTCQIRKTHGKGPYKKAPKTCVVCGKIFMGVRGNAKTCSEKCRWDFARIDRNRRYKHLKEIGEFDESATLPNVFARFGGVCQSCGEHLSFDEDWLSGRYPSIDHVIPLSKGGTHTWDNIQLLCRSCNCKKSNKTEIFA